MTDLRDQLLEELLKMDLPKEIERKVERNANCAPQFWHFNSKNELY